MVECYLAKVDVAGPNPVSRSIFLCPFSIEILFGRHLSQEVRQRSAKSPSPVRIRKVPPFSSIFSAGVAELVDARDLKSLGITSCTGSSPVSGTILSLV